MSRGLLMKRKATKGTRRLSENATTTTGCGGRGVELTERRDLKLVDRERSSCWVLRRIRGGTLKEVRREGLKKRRGQLQKRLELKLTKISLPSLELTKDFLLLRGRLVLLLFLLDLPLLVADGA